METISNLTPSKEETLTCAIHDFFDCRKLGDHLTFLDLWMEKVILNQHYKKFLKRVDLHFFFNKFLNLLTACDDLTQSEPINFLHFEESVKIPEHFIQLEQKALLFYPNYLRRKEICNPIVAIAAIFKRHKLDYYREALHYLVNADLASQNESKHKKLLYSTYTSLKKMVEACWLIHERYVSKNSYAAIPQNPIVDDFALSCPLLLRDEYLDNPYLMIESFYSFASLKEYKEDITYWFRLALNEQANHEHPVDLLFIHNQLIQLVHAGYIIGTTKLRYEPSRNYTKRHDTFGHWLLDRTANEVDIQSLSKHYRENPLEYCIEHLTLKEVIHLRYGLKEWLEAALSVKNSITALDHTYVFDQFESLQKILEALFLLIIQPTSSTQLSTNNTL